MKLLLLTSSYDTGDADINVLLCNDDKSGIDIEEKYIDKIKQVFSSNKNRDTLSPSIARLREGVPVTRRPGNTEKLD